MEAWQAGCLALALLLSCVAGCSQPYPEDSSDVDWSPLSTLPPPTATVSACDPTLEPLPAEPVIGDGLDYGTRFFLSPGGGQLVINPDSGVALVDVHTGARTSLDIDGFPRFWIADHLLIFSSYDGEQSHFYSYDVQRHEIAPFEVRWEYSGGATHPSLLTYDQIGALRDAAADAWSIPAVPMEAPVTDAWWHRILVLIGLPDPPRNLLVYVSAESHWEKYPLVPAQLTIDQSGGAVWLDTAGDFFVADEPCAGDPYPYVLYRRSTLLDDAFPLGRIPYAPEYWSTMAWLPDGRYIYMKHVQGDHYVISRLHLPPY